MLMITAALREELDIALDLFPEARSIPAMDGRLWHAARGDRAFSFLKTGVGPRKAAARLQAAFEIITPSRILTVGYGGALVPQLKLGTLVAVEKALAFSLDEECPKWECGRVDETFLLVGAGPIVRSAEAAGLAACAADALTSAHVLGDPAHKRALHRNFNASVVDMETAALAQVAASRLIPFSCVRAISDEEKDTFLIPFSYDPSVGIPARAMRLLSAGMADTYRQWKENARAARNSLSRFLVSYLFSEERKGGEQRAFEGM